MSFAHLRKPTVPCSEKENDFFTPMNIQTRTQSVRFD